MLRRNQLHKRNAFIGFWIAWTLIVISQYYRQIWTAAFQSGALFSDHYSIRLFSIQILDILKALDSFAFPYWRQAFMRIEKGVFILGISLLAFLFLGSLLIRILHWSYSNWIERFLFQLILGIGVFSYLSFLQAMLNVYRPANVRWLVLGLSILGILWVAKISVGNRQAITCSLQNFRRKDFGMGARMWVPIILLALTIALLGALAPETEYDALWYHLGLPQSWLSNGGAVDYVPEYISLYPLFWELLYGIGIAFGSPIAAKLLHFFTLLLTALMIYEFVKRFLPHISPWLAVAIFVTVPTVLWEATTAYIDLAIAFLIGMSIYALLRYVQEGSAQWLMSAAVALGMGIAAKHSSLVVALLLCFVLFLLLWKRDKSIRKAIGPTIVLGTLSMLFPLPWYLRNFYMSGNPVFPFLYDVFGAFPPERWSDTTQAGLDNFFSRFGYPRTFVNLLLLPWNMTVHAARFGGTLGPVFLIMLPLFLLLKRTWISISLAAITLGFFAFWASPLSSFQMRFVIIVIPLFAILASAAWAALQSHIEDAPLVKAYATGLLFLLLLLNLPPFTSLHEGDRNIWDGWLTHVVHEIPLAVNVGLESEEEYLTRRVPSYGAWQFINKDLPHEAIVLTFSGGDHFYSDRVRIPNDSTVAREAVWGATDGVEDKVTKKLRELNVTHLLYDLRALERGYLDEIVLGDESFRKRWLVEEYSDSLFSVFRLDYPDE